MKPGRELDALIAEKVMGIKVRFEIYHYRDEHHDVISYYSTDIAAAWEVVERLKQTCQRDVLSLYSPSDDNDSWFALFERKWPSHDHNSVYDGESGETAPHAICLAALKAVGVKVNEAK